MCDSNYKWDSWDHQVMQPQLASFSRTLTRLMQPPHQVTSSHSYLILRWKQQLGAEWPDWLQNCQIYHQFADLGPIGQISFESEKMHFCLFIFDMSQFDGGSFWFNRMPPLMCLLCCIAFDCFFLFTHSSSPTLLHFPTKSLAIIAKWKTGPSHHFWASTSATNYQRCTFCSSNSS